MLPLWTPVNNLGCFATWALLGDDLLTFAEVFLLEEPD